MNRHIAKTISEVKLPDARKGAKRAAARAVRHATRDEIATALAEMSETFL